MATSNTSIAALGRPFTLGMLYDARRDELIPGFTLWDEKMLQSKTTETTKPSSSFNIAASDSIEARSSLLNVDASLQASFMSGLIEVSGSANYMNDKKKFQNQSRVTCQYKATTVFKELAVTDFQTLSDKQKAVIKNGVATHVVTGILYGADAIYVFDSEKLEASSVQNIQGSMQAVIKKIPSFSLEGSVDIKLTQEEKSVSDKFSCKFYGDFILESNPATFQDAVRTYVELPKLLGKGGENSVPLKVWLMPLKQLVPEAAEVKEGISSGLVRKIQQVIEDLRAAQMRCNDCQADPVVQKFSQLQAELTRFYTLVGDYEFSLQQMMAEKFPLIREKKEKESSVEKFIQDREKSLFSRANLEKWLNQKEREINVMRSCLQILKGTKVLQNYLELQKELLDAGVERGLVFVFTSLGLPDQHLDAMAKYLDSGETVTVSEDLWYYSSDVIAKMRADAECVYEFGKGLQNRGEFITRVAAIDNSSYKGSSIYNCHGVDVSDDNYVKRDVPQYDTITHKYYILDYATGLTLDLETLNPHLHLSEDNKMITFKSRQNIADTPKQFNQTAQVLCNEKLKGQHYWEVELSGASNDSVYACAAYESIPRKGYGDDVMFGHNSVSWAFGREGNKIKAKHNNKTWEADLPYGLKKIGVLLDWSGGTLSFYAAFHYRVNHLYTFKHKFTEAVIPALYAGKDNNYAYICPI